VSSTCHCTQQRRAGGGGGEERYLDPCHGYRRDDRDDLLLVRHDPPDILVRGAVAQGESDGRDGRGRHIPQVEGLPRERSLRRKGEGGGHLENVFAVSLEQSGGETLQRVRVGHLRER
jgi:hypothetical protein